MNGMWNKKDHLDLLTPIKARIVASNLPYIIENVPAAPLSATVKLCGTMFDLGVGLHRLRRHRIFESNMSIVSDGLKCNHGSLTIGVYGDHARCRRHRYQKYEAGMDFPDKDKLDLGSRAMGITWMNWKELSQAIPPAYTEFIGRQLIDSFERQGRWEKL